MKIKVSEFNLKDTVLSGQAFRITEESDSSFTVVLNDRVINIKQEGNSLYIKSSNYENLESIICDYFDLNRDYNKINKMLISNDYLMNNIIYECKGYKIMNQDAFEMCISYIISQNNNVKRISNSIEKMSQKYGEKIIFEGKDYYLFPKFESIKNISALELREFGVGFRDKYIVNFLEELKNNNNYINDIKNMNTEKALNELMKIKGIGLKVASCILLFGFKRLDVFPIDTWVKQTMSQIYNIKDDQKTIEKFAKEHYGIYSGLAVQYMFHYGRNKREFVQK